MNMLYSVIMWLCIYLWMKIGKQNKAGTFQQVYERSSDLLPTKFKKEDSLSIPKQEDFKNCLQKQERNLVDFISFLYS